MQLQTSGDDAELLGRQQNCGFPKNLGMPYWNWTLDYKDGLDKAPLWGTEPWQIGPATGTGKNWIVEEFPETVAYPSPHRISRRYNRHPFRKSVESEVLTSSFAANSKVAATNTKVANNTVLPNHIIQKAKEQTGNTRRSKLAKTEKPENIKPANQPKRLSPSDLAKRFSTEEKAFKGSLSQKVKEDDETTNMTGEEMVSPEAIRWVFEARDGDYETFAQRVEGTVSDFVTCVRISARKLRRQVALTASRRGTRELLDSQSRHQLFARVEPLLLASLHGRARVVQLAEAQSTESGCHRWKTDAVGARRPGSGKCRDLRHHPPHGWYLARSESEGRSRPERQRSLVLRVPVDLPFSCFTHKQYRSLDIVYSSSHHNSVLPSVDNVISILAAITTTVTTHV